jgi:hypothetical protein
MEFRRENLAISRNGSFLVCMHVRIRQRNGAGHATRQSADPQYRSRSWRMGRRLGVETGL